MEMILTSALEQGLLYCFMVLGVFITFRVLDFPDLTVDGSLPLGAAVIGGAHRERALAVAGHRSPGSRAGMCAGLRDRFPAHPAQVGRGDANNYGPKLLAGILTMTALYTVNLRVMGRSNIPLLGVESVFEKLARSSRRRSALEPGPRWPHSRSSSSTCSTGSCTPSSASRCRRPATTSR